jgi:biotin carboxylase
MQPGIVLFLGMVRRGEYESLRKRGIPLGVLVDTNSKHRLADVSQFEVVEKFDFSRPLKDLIEAVLGIQQRRGIACLYNVIEFYVAQTADVAAALLLPCISSASARLCLDKSIMRERFQERIGPDAAARFQVVDSEADLLAFADRLGYPVFLQPANVSASMWSTRNNDRQTLLGNFHTIRDEVPKYYERLGKKGQQLTVVVAEYLEGRNSSIDCIVDSAGEVYTTPVVDVLTGQDVGIDDFHHFARIVPSRLPRAEQEELSRLAVAGVKALDMTTSAAHVEFIGRKLGEIAARPGGNRPRILELAHGIDELHAYYQALTGQEPDLRADRKYAAAVVTPFPAKNGTLRSIRHLDRLAKLPGYLYHEVRAQPGTAVGLSKRGYRAPLYVELMSSSTEHVLRSVDELASWSDLYEVE